jgi:hypothetical protein
MKDIKNKKSCGLNGFPIYIPYVLGLSYLKMCQELLREMVWGIT